MQLCAVFDLAFVDLEFLIFVPCLDLLLFIFLLIFLSLVVGSLLVDLLAGFAGGVAPSSRRPPPTRGNCPGPCPRSLPADSRPTEDRSRQSPGAVPARWQPTGPGRRRSGVTRIHRLPAAAIGITLAVAACAQQPAPVGTVSGLVRGWGGPAVMIHGKSRQAINGAPMTHQAVTLTGGHRVVRVTTDASGRFSARVPPGTYDVTSCASTTRVVVQAGQSSSLDLRCYFP